MALRDGDLLEMGRWCLAAVQFAWSYLSVRLPDGVCFACGAHAAAAGLLSTIWSRAQWLPVVPALVKPAATTGLSLWWGMQVASQQLMLSLTEHWVRKGYLSWESSHSLQCLGMLRSAFGYGTWLCLGRKLCQMSSLRQTHSCQQQMCAFSIRLCSGIGCNKIIVC